MKTSSITKGDPEHQELFNIAYKGVAYALVRGQSLPYSFLTTFALSGQL